ncbi:hypothetical protein KY284_025879 [Solanum tuberosum]|nr:hypothetical protein KY284_025879 [Solanum tuberosum]
MAFAMDTIKQEKVRRFEEFIDRRLKPDLVHAIAERDKVFEQQKIFSDLRSNIENLEKNNVTNLKTLVNIGSEVYLQADVPDTTRIFVDVGLGFHVEFTWSEALNYISAREEKLARQIEEYTRLIASIKAQIKMNSSPPRGFSCARKVSMAWWEGLDEARVLIAKEPSKDGNKVEQLLSLRHPKSGNATCYLCVDGSLQELHWFKQSHGSWFLGDYVCEDGRLYTATPVDPVFVLLPIFEEARMKKNDDPGKFRQVDEIIYVVGYPGYQHLSSIAENCMQVVCDVKDVGMTKFFRLNDEKMLKWLCLKVIQLKKTLLTLDKNYAARDKKEILTDTVSIIGEYLKEEPWLKLLCSKLSIDLQEDTKASNSEMHSSPMDNSFESFNHEQWEGFWSTLPIIKAAMIFKATFKSEPNDVLLASSMKTGSTWLKAICVSIMQDLSPLEEVVENFCNGVHHYGPFFEHVLEYWEESKKKPQKILFLKYEDLKIDPKKEVAKIALFLGKPFGNEEDLEIVLNKCSLERLKNLEVNKSGSIISYVHNSAFFRKGVVGDWKNHMTPEMEEQLDKITKLKLQGSGLEL